MRFQVPSLSEFITRSIFPLIAVLAVFTIPALAGSGAGEGTELASSSHESMIDNPWSLAALGIFFLSYVAVLFEEKTHLRKSKPVMLGAGLIWVCIAIVAPDYGIDHHNLREAVSHGLEEYASLLLFLLAAMTYIAAMQERRVFATLRCKLVTAGMNMRQLFWATGIFAFCLSPIADNLTTALVLGAVVMAVGANDPKFVSIACINIVNAANKNKRSDAYSSRP